MFYKFIYVMLRKIFLLVFFVLIFSESLWPQTLTDSTRKEIFHLIRQHKFHLAKKKIDSIGQYENQWDEISINQAELYKLKSQYYSYKYLLDSAIYYQTKAWNILKQINYDQYFFNYLRTLAYYNWEKGNYSKSLEYSHQILRDIEKIDSSRHNSLYNILGLNYLDLGNYSLSEKYFRKSVSLSKKYKSEHYLGVVYANIGRLYLLQNKYDKALKYYQKGSNLELKYNDFAAASRSYADIGSIYVQKENYEYALKSLNQGKNYALESKDDIGLCRNYLAFGKLYYKNQDFNKAKSYYHKAVNLSKKKNTQKELMQGYYGLYETYDQKGNYREAKEYLHDYYLIYKDLYNVKKIVQIENLQHKLNLQEEKTANQKAQLEKQKTIKNLLFLIVILSFLTAGVLLLFLIRSIKHRTSLKRKNEEIEKQKKELKKAKERAENSEALKDHFLKNISHEIRTPLNGIIGFSSIIAQPDITQTDKNNYQRIIDQNAKMLLSTIEDIIDIAKIKTQQVDIFKEKFDANQIIQEIQKLIHFEKDYLNKNEIEVIVEQNNKEKQIIYNDESKLRKVLVLLGNNAIKFTDKGHIKLGYYLKGSNIIFFIEDTGSGISQEDQQTIFETFRQADKETNQTKDGIGIGLTIAKAFVEIMGGEIWFKSAINNGTTFYFSLPLKENNS